MTDETTEKDPVQVAKELMQTRVSALVKWAEHEQLGGLAVIGVDLQGNAVVSYTSIHELITVCLHDGLLRVLDCVEERMVEDGTIEYCQTRVGALEAEEAEENEAFEDEGDDETPEAAPAPKLQ